MRQERSNRWERMGTLGEFSPRRAAWEMSPPPHILHWGWTRSYSQTWGRGFAHCTGESLWLFCGPGPREAGKGRRYEKGFYSICSCGLPSFADKKKRCYAAWGKPCPGWQAAVGSTAHL